MTRKKQPAMPSASSSTTAGDACPCCSGKPYLSCCAPLHQGASPASPEALMRSRYSAYVLQLEAYLLATWHPETRPPSLDLVSAAVRWLGLEVKAAPPPAGDTAWVEFVARYKEQGRAFRLHERSCFRQVAERWFYVDGQFPENRAKRR